MNILSLNSPFPFSYLDIKSFSFFPCGMSDRMKKEKRKEERKEREREREEKEKLDKREKREEG